jgi:hypothetical protein
LELTRVASPVMPAAAGAPPPPFAAPVDAPPAATRVVAFELPWDEAASTPGRRRLVAAVGADGPNWSGAALYADRGDGQLWPLGSAPRRPAVTGTALDALGPANPLLLDRGGTVTVMLTPGSALSPASLSDLASGANLALIGDELVQFAQANPLGDGRWRLSGFVRGCYGTEAGVGRHAPGEPFALLAGGLTTLDPDVTGESAATMIVAVGRGDAVPVTSAVRLSGIGLRPLAPVHARVTTTLESDIILAWMRRARGAWTWRDGVDVPLVEERERYIVTYEVDGEPSSEAEPRTLREWSVTAPTLTLARDEIADLLAAGPGRILVRQQGTYALSAPLHLTTLA